MFATSTYGQTVEWLVSAGGIKSDKGCEIVVDQDGYIYETGYYNEEANFGPYNTGFSYPHSKEAYVAKLDPNGNYLWVKHGLNYYDDRGLGLDVDPFGNVYVTGTCWGGLVWGSLNVYNTSSYTDQIFVVKMDSDGNEIWMKNAGVNEPSYPYNDDHGQDLVCDSNGNIYVTGFLSNNDPTDHLATFDAITVPVAAQDSVAFIAKLSNDGVWQWVEVFDGIYAHRDNAIALDDDENVYVTGSFVDDSQFGTQTITSYGNQDIYVVKYDSNGNFQWVTQAGSVKSDRGNDICYGFDGYMYVTGEFRDVCSWGTATTLDNNGGPKGRDIFVAKISKDGEWKWANMAGSKKGSDKGIGIIANGDGNIFVSGQFSAEANFDSLIVDSDGDSVDVFVAAIDTTGAWRWVVAGGGPGFDRGLGIDVDTSCNVYVTGWYTNNMDMQNDAITADGADDKAIFTLKISDACFGYPPPEEEPPPTDTTVVIVDSGPSDPCILTSANVITPNNDGSNDEIYFTSPCDKIVGIVILNRWGRTVYSSDDSTQPWKGISNDGDLVPEGVYFWKVHVKNEDGSDTFKHGSITLIY
ncbi:gliding motility-associated C-terminal domain-containing protein [Paracrocinitomix mangrovi]|uniref:T9SS type B sorting domain-containing protein n=1 Tax=Paracrocinitomix mangrovi TaxID=2862509 RepID=UPI001C8E7D94|nr:gliding motility-associated C-terminal domain-containing protein [Paracrocinitomix mangrovi]UKN00799.1 gliding motility-associated C-terminal domain-containing protein [Paracrocinitomix mangrovi]